MFQIAQDDIIRRFVRGFFPEYITVDGSEVGMMFINCHAKLCQYAATIPKIHINFAAGYQTARELYPYSRVLSLPEQTEYT